MGPCGWGITATYSCSPLGCLPQGCFDQILEEIRTNADVVGGVAAGIAALEVSPQALPCCSLLIPVGLVQPHGLPSALGWLLSLPPWAPLPLPPCG